eukprot:353796-Chlamydomonas_euryale.AAC.9
MAAITRAAHGTSQSPAAAHARLCRYFISNQLLPPTAGHPSHAQQWRWDNVADALHLPPLRAIHTTFPEQQAAAGRQPTYARPIWIAEPHHVGRVGCTQV